MHFVHHRSEEMRIFAGNTGVRLRDVIGLELRVTAKLHRQKCCKGIRKENESLESGPKIRLDGNDSVCERPDPGDPNDSTRSSMEPLKKKTSFKFLRAIIFSTLAKGPHHRRFLSLRG